MRYIWYIWCIYIYVYYVVYIVSSININSKLTLLNMILRINNISLYYNKKGDHLAYSASRKRLDGFKRYNHGNKIVQATSIRMIAENDYNFTC